MKRAYLALAIATCSFPAAAVAQTDDKVNVVEGIPADAKEARKITDRFAECAARRHLDRAQAFVLDPVSYFKRADAQRLFDHLCLTTFAMQRAILKAKRNHMRYAMAEALISIQYRNGLPADMHLAAPLNHAVWESPAPLPVDAKPEEIEAWQRDEQGRLTGEYFSTLGECVVRAAPMQSYALVITKPATKAETAQFKALAPSVANCVKQGEQLNASKFALRGAIALNLYRLARAPRVAETVQ